MADHSSQLTWDLIAQARTRISGKVNRTPVLTSTSLDANSGAQLYFKCENFQKCGAFKARGAANAVFALSAEEARRGVATHSSGNHAAALARAARLRGIPAHIVMPDNTAQAKRAALERLAHLCRIVGGGEDDHRHVWTSPPELRDRRHPAHAGHGQVEKDRVVVAVLPGEVETFGRFASLEDHGFCVVVGQQCRDALPNHRLIVDHQQLHGRP